MQGLMYYLNESQKDEDWYDPNMKFFMFNNEYGKKYNVDVTPLYNYVDGKFGNYNPEDKTRHYIQLGKQFHETIRLLVNPTAYLSQKTAPMPRIAYEQFTGMTLGNNKYVLDHDKAYDFEGGFESAYERVQHVVENITPISFRGQSFALTLPQSKGMTFYKAQEEITNLIVGHLNPTTWDYVVNEYGEADYINYETYFTKWNDIFVACELNGIDGMDAFGNAYKEVRMYYQSNAIKAAEEEDWDNVDYYLTGLTKLTKEFNKFEDLLYQNTEFTAEDRHKFNKAWMSNWVLSGEEPVDEGGIQGELDKREK